MPEINSSVPDAFRVPDTRQERFARTRMLLGAEKLERLSRARVAVFGLGGVGGYVVEALVRSGIGALDLIDHDWVSPSNLNRQILATRKTIGRYKTDVARERVMDINPEARVEVFPVFIGPETVKLFDFTNYDYVIDAIDNVTGKILLIEQALRVNTPVISSMGTGNKLYPSLLEVTDLAKTSVCPLARVMRRELKKRGIRHLKVVCSREAPLVPDRDENFVGGTEKPIPGSISFVPSVAGLLLAGEVIRDLAGVETKT